MVFQLWTFISQVGFPSQPCLRTPWHPLRVIHIPSMYPLEISWNIQHELPCGISDGWHLPNAECQHWGNAPAGNGSNFWLKEFSTVHSSRFKHYTENSCIVKFIEISTIYPEHVLWTLDMFEHDLTSKDHGSRQETPSKGPTVVKPTPMGKHHPQYTRIYQVVQPPMGCLWGDYGTDYNPIRWDPINSQVALVH